MKIASLVKTPILIEWLRKRGELVSETSKDVDMCFVEWENTNVESPSKSVIKQLNFINFYTKKVDKPLVIFDKFLTMKPSEISYFVSKNVRLLEPCVNGRKCFSWQPFPIDVPSSIRLWEGKRDIDLLVYVDGLTVSQIDRGLKIFDKIKVHLYSQDTEIQKYYNNTGNKVVIDSVNLMNVKTCLLLGNDIQYTQGYLPEHLNQLLLNGVIPLLPMEHRWFYSLFQDTIINHFFDFEFILSKWGSLNYGIIHDIYKRIDEQFQEMYIWVI